MAIAADCKSADFGLRWLNQITHRVRDLVQLYFVSIVDDAINIDEWRDSE